MAAKLGIPVQTLQRATTSKEFVRWRTYLDKEPNEFNTLHYYLAMIAMMIAKVNVKNPEKIKLEDFILDFVVRTKGIKKDVNLSSPIAEFNKRMILASLGVKMDKDNGPQPKTLKRSVQPRKTPKRSQLKKRR